MLYKARITVILVKLITQRTNTQLRSVAVVLSHASQPCRRAVATQTDEAESCKKKQCKKPTTTLLQELQRPPLTQHCANLDAASRP